MKTKFVYQRNNKQPYFIIFILSMWMQISQALSHYKSSLVYKDNISLSVLNYKNIGALSQIKVVLHNKLQLKKTLNR